jgi:APA family basic amino acid/polyamine antiporter
MPGSITQTASKRELNRSLGLFDSTMIVAGSMIGTGIFIVSAEMSRQVGSVGWLLISWVLSGLLTVAAALSYGELAAMMPRAGGQYVYLREAWSPIWGFLYGWTLFLVIQSGTIAAVAVGFARYLGTLWPAIAENQYLIAPIHISRAYAVSLSTAQLAGVLVILLLTLTNMRGIQYGRVIQNVFTTSKIAALSGVIAVGFIAGRNAPGFAANFSSMWTPSGYTPVAPGLGPDTAFGLFVALCVAQVGSLFAADAWNNITFTAGEVKTPHRNVPLSLALGTCIVIALYLCANLAYVLILPLDQVQHAPSDRVAGAMLQAVFPSVGGALMAIAIMISAFGCANGMVMTGARAYYAMAKDGLFFSRAGVVNRAHVPGWSLMLQGTWAAILVLFRVYDAPAQSYGNLFSNLLDYVISAALFFYILTIAGVFRLRRSRPSEERPYRAWGYPGVPALYILVAAVILTVLLVYRTSTTFPGVIIVAMGVPVYFGFRRASWGKGGHET